MRTANIADGIPWTLLSLVLRAGRGRVKVTQLDCNRKFARDRNPVTQLQVVPQWSALLAICNGGLQAFSLAPDEAGKLPAKEAAPPAIKLPPAARGAARFAVAPGETGAAGRWSIA